MNIRGCRQHHQPAYALAHQPAYALAAKAAASANQIKLIRSAACAYLMMLVKRHDKFDHRYEINEILCQCDGSGHGALGSSSASTNQIVDLLPTFKNWRHPRYVYVHSIRVWSRPQHANAESGQQICKLARWIQESSTPRPQQTQTQSSIYPGLCRRRLV
jgi:hypothetical protein